MTRNQYPSRRQRRLRTRASVRDLVRETVVSPSDLIQPVFVHDVGNDDVPIRSMPGQFRRTEDSLLRFAERAWRAGVRGLALFPRVSDELKSDGAEEAWSDAGLVPRIVKKLKATLPELLVITDVALDPYSSHGQDGLVEDGRIVNDPTVEALVKQAVCHARAGADMVAPSDMMDGRIGAIRDALDENGFSETLIMAYSAKYASAFYGPFREALDSAPRGGADKNTYQMDPGNTDEALQEVALDFDEGADIVMVKPGMPYLDVLWRVKQHVRRPVAVYQVSGEYAMLEAAGANGWLDRDKVVQEALLGLKRAGADIILSYYGVEAAERWLTRR
ncbi:MAG: porphobilinogen synthase [Myxococcota bacterium]